MDTDGPVYDSAGNVIGVLVIAGSNLRDGDRIDGTKYVIDYEAIKFRNDVAINDILPNGIRLERGSGIQPHTGLPVCRNGVTTVSPAAPSPRSTTAGSRSTGYPPTTATRAARCTQSPHRDTAPLSESPAELPAASRPVWCKPPRFPGRPSSINYEKTWKKHPTLPHHLGIHLLPPRFLHQRTPRSHRLVATRRVVPRALLTLVGALLTVNVADRELRRDQCRRQRSTDRTAGTVHGVGRGPHRVVRPWPREPGCRTCGPADLSRHGDHPAPTR